MPQCTRCETAPELKPMELFQKLYCPVCSFIYKRDRSVKTNGGYVVTQDIYIPPPPPFTLQRSPQLNPAFTTEVPNVQVVPRRDKTYPLTILKDEGFSYPPLLHFIWFGVPSSETTFAPVLKWSAMLPQDWSGICLWVDNNCLKTLIPKMAVEECQIEIFSPLGTPLNCSKMIARGRRVPIYILSIEDHLARLPQEHIGDYSTRKQFNEAVDRVMKHLVGIQEANERRKQAYRMLADIIRDFDHLPDTEEVDSWIHMNSLD